MRFHNHKTTTRAFFGHSVCKRAFAINHAKTRQRAKYAPVVTLDPADNVLIRRGDEWRVSSRLIANRLDMDHDSITRVMRNNKEDFEVYGKLPNVEYKECISDVVNGGGELLDYKSRINPIKRGKKQRHYLLNIDQFELLASFLRGNGENRDRIMALRHSIIKNNRYIRERLEKREIQLLNYHPTRELLAEHDARPEHYMKLAAMENRFIGSKRGVSRDLLSPDQLNKLTACQVIENQCITKALSEGKTLDEAISHTAKILRVIG